MEMSSLWYRRAQGEHVCNEVVKVAQYATLRLETTIGQAAEARRGTGLGRRRIDGQNTNRSTNLEVELGVFNRRVSQRNSYHDGVGHRR